MKNTTTKQTTKIHKQTALIEFRNSPPGITIFKSKTPITIDKIAKYLTETDGFNPDRDSITFLDDTIETVNLK